MNSKIDGVPRELLQKVDDVLYIMTGEDSYQRLAQKYGTGWWGVLTGMRAELCSVLDAPVVERQPSCPKCNDTGEVDSGGIQPWGEGINVTCDCQDAPPELAELQAENERLKSDLDECDGDRWSLRTKRDELQATIARLTAENEVLNRSNEEYSGAAVQSGIECDRLTAEIERLTVENDEPEWHQMMTKLEDQNTELRAEIKWLKAEKDSYQWGASVEAQAGDESRAEVATLKVENERLKAGQGELPPFAKKVIRKLERFAECSDDGQGADIGRDWFDILTKLGLLNRVQRSPGLWETSQQGDDILSASQPAPIYTELVRLLTRARIYARGKFRDEIDACLSGQPAPVSVVLPERMTLEKASGLSDYPPEVCMYWYNQALDDVSACLDKVKELNQ